jgi:hypothetical protein
MLLDYGFFFYIFKLIKLIRLNDSDVDFFYFLKIPSVPLTLLFSHLKNFFWAHDIVPTLI